MKLVISKQYIYAFSLSYMLSFLALLNLGNEIFNLIGLKTQLDTVFMYGVLLGCIVLGAVVAVTDKGRFKLDCFFLFAFWLGAFLLSILIYPQNAKFLFTSWGDYSSNPLYLIFLYSIPGYVFARHLEDYDAFKKCMKVFSYITVIMSIIIFFFAKGSSASQYMTFSYNMLTQLFFLLLFKPEKNKILHYIVVAVGLFVFAFGGARGAMVSLFLVFFVMYFINYKPTVKNVILSALVIIVVALFALFKNEVLVFISELLESASIDSRTFRYLMAGDLLDDSNRFPLYVKTLNNVTVFGKGLMGDRLFLGSYPHNIILEILVHFGLVCGPIIICLLFVCIGIAMIKKSNPEFIFVILLLPCGLLKLMVTGSYLHQEPTLYIMLGFCINSILRNINYENSDDKHSLWNRKHR